MYEITSEMLELKQRCFDLEAEYLEQGIPEEKLCKSIGFAGLLLYITNNLFRRYANIYTKSTLDYNNIDLLDYIFNDIYSMLCLKYGQRRTMIKFSNFVNIDRDTITRWKKPSDARSGTVKKWYAACEADLLDGAVNENSIGCFFGLKTGFGYQESIKIDTGAEGLTSASSNQRLLEKYATNQLPTLPED